MASVSKSARLSQSPTSNGLENAEEMLHVSEALHLLCEECTSTTATCRCVKCECLMCFECFEKVHSISKYMRKHSRELLTPESVVSGCKEHSNRPFEYFCVDDEVAVCSHCVVLGEHRNHKMRPLEEQKRMTLDSMASLSRRATEFVQNLDKQLDSVNVLIAASKSDEESIMDELAKNFGMLDRVLKLLRNKLEADSREKFAAQRIALKDAQTLFLSKKGDLENLLVDADGFERKNLAENVCLVKKLTGAINEDVVSDANVYRIKLDMDSSKLIEDLMQHGRFLECKADDFTPENSCIEGPEKTNHGQSNVSAQVMEAFASCCPWSPPPIHRLAKLTSSQGDTCESQVAAGNNLPPKPVFVGEDVKAVSTEARQSSLDITHAVDSRQLSEVADFSSVKPQTFAFSKIIDVAPVALNSENDQQRNVCLNVSNTRIHDNQTNSCSTPSAECSFSPKEMPAYVIDSVASSCVKTNKSSEDFGFWNGKNVGFGSDLEPAVVCHIKDPSRFWINFAKDKERLNKMLQEIQDFYSSSRVRGEKLPPSFDVGDMVVAKFSDGIWYRAQVLSEWCLGSGLGVRVHFIDFGNDDVVAPDRIHSIRPSFLKVPHLASLCCLADVRPVNGSTWSTKAVASFTRMIHDVSVLVKIVKQGRMLGVGLYFPSNASSFEELTAVSDALVFLELAERTSSDGSLPPCSTKKRINGKRIQTILPTASDDVIPVVVTSVVSPTEMYVQVRQPGFVRFTEMMEDIQKVCETDVHNELRLLVPYVGLHCLVKFEKEGKWCRAVVTELLKKGCVKVQNVDYGSSEIVSIFNLKRLLSKYFELPAQAFRCALADVNESQGNVEKQSLAELLECAGDDLLYMKVRQILPGEVLSVCLGRNFDISGVSIDTALPATQSKSVGSPSSCQASSDSLAKSSRTSPNESSQSESIGRKLSSKQSLVEETDENSRSDVLYSKSCVVPNGSDLPKVLVSHYVTPDEFYIQVGAERNLNSLEKLMQELKAEYKKRKPIQNREWKTGDECVAQRRSDGRWYRGKVADIQSDEAEVVFQDYGFVDVVRTDRLHAVDAKFMQDAWYSTRCHIDGLQPYDQSGQWPPSTCEILRLCFEKKECRIAISGDAVGGISMPVDVVVLQNVPGSALTPDNYAYISVTRWLLEKKLASPVSDEYHFAGLDNYLSDDEKLTDCSESSEPADDDDLAYFPPVEPALNSVILAVTAVGDDGCIYGQETKSDLTNLRDLISLVQAHYYGTKPDSDDTVWRLGQPVAAQFSEDNLFYRAKIVGFTDSGIQVQFVDFGTVEVMNKDRLRVMRKSFMLEPIQCLRCYLYEVLSASSDGKWSSQAISFITSLLNNDACKVTIRDVDSVRSRLFVDLETPDGVDLGAVLCERGFAVRANKRPKSNVDKETKPALKRCLPERIVRSPYQQMAVATVDEMLHVTVTEVENAGTVYAQHVHMENPESSPAAQRINADLDALLALSKMIVSDVSTYKPLSDDDLKPGAACVAQYSFDGCWYRAEIICVNRIQDKTEIGVRYVDYGSSAFVSIDELCRIPEKHLALPMQSRRCRLRGLWSLSDTDSCTAGVAEKLNEMLASRVLIAVVKQVFDNGDVLVDLFDRDRYLVDGPACPCVYEDLVDDELFRACDGRPEDDVIVEGEEEEKKEDEENVSKTD